MLRTAPAVWLASRSSSRASFSAKKPSRPEKSAMTPAGRSSTVSVAAMRERGAQASRAAPWGRAQGRPGDARPGRERLLLGAQEPRLGAPAVAVQLQRRRLAGPHRDQRRAEVEGDDAREGLHHPPDDRLVAGERGARAADLVEQVQGVDALGELGEQLLALAAQAVVVDRVLERDEQLGLVPRLGDVAVDVAQVDGVDQVRRVAVAGQEDGRDVQALAPGARDELDAAQVGHLLVGDQDVYRPLPQDAQRLVAGRRGEDVVGALEGPGEDLDDIGLVVDEEDERPTLGRAHGIHPGPDVLDPGRKPATLSGVWRGADASRCRPEPGSPPRLGCLPTFGHDRAMTIRWIFASSASSTRRARARHDCGTFREVDGGRSGEHCWDRRAGSAVRPEAVAELSEVGHVAGLVSP
jgi:hypothetical protein